MTYYSNYMSDDQIGDLLVCIEDESFLSKRDGCRVALVQCVRCDRKYEEELETAKARIVSRVGLLCLLCDDEAIVPAFKGVTIQIGWFLG